MKRFIECYLPVTACNLKCSYCYVVQEKRRSMQILPLKYSIPTIKNALTKERMGGVCFFSICGAGETMLPEYTIPLIKAILENGHFVNVTTNGTLSVRFQEIVQSFSQNELQRLNFSFSLHYLELKQKDLLNAFFDNIDLIRKAGCSFVLQMNLCDDYLPYLDEIKEICIKRAGALPQLAATRRETDTKVELETNLSFDEYVKRGREFDSPLFECTIENFNVKREEFCYAGEWSFVLNLETGLLRRCYCSCMGQYIFGNLKTPIRSLAVGRYCNSAFCMNSSHFMSQGIIPEIDCPSYVDLRNRTTVDGGEWYSRSMKTFLSEKLGERNQPYSRWKKMLSEIFGLADRIAYWSFSRYRMYSAKKWVPK